MSSNKDLKKKFTRMSSQALWMKAYRGGMPKKDAHILASILERRHTISNVK